MLHFEGDKEFPQAPAELYGKLSDPRFLVLCVPGIETVKQAEADHAVWTLRPGLSFLRGTLEVTLRVLETVPGQSVRLTALTKGIGSSADVEAALTFTPQDAGTRIHWTADVKALGGLLKAVPQGLIQASARKVIDDVWAEVAAKLNAPT